MSTKKQQERKQIMADLNMGKTQYVIRRGVIGWGFPTLALYIPLNLIINRLFGTSFAEGFRNLFPFTILLALVAFSIAGIYMGNFRWKQLLIRANEGKKKKSQSSQESKKQ